MEFCFSLLGGDLRQPYLADALRRKGHKVLTFGVPGAEDSPNFADGRILILPTPSLSPDGHIRGTSLTPADAALLVPNAEMSFGSLTEKVEDVFPGIIDTAKWEDLALLNAVPTAEGAIHLAVNAMAGTIQGSRFLVVGAGRIGLCLGQKLKALGGRVTVTARKPKDFAAVEALGLETDITHTYAHGLGDYDCVFNTVPELIFTKAQLNALPAGCPVIELASAPGGMDRAVCGELGLHYISGAALPGRTAPKAAGENLARSLLMHLSMQT